MKMSVLIWESKILLLPVMEKCLKINISINHKNKKSLNSNANYIKKQKGSNNRNKARIKLAKAFEKLTNQKENYMHSVVNELLKYYDIIFMENLNVKGLLKNRKLAKAIQEVGFCRFKKILEDKSYNNGKQVIFIDRFYPSSKICSVCGYKKHDLKLSDREWICLQCGEHHDRDINAAMNILLEGERIIGVRSTEYTLMENPTVDDRDNAS